MGWLTENLSALDTTDPGLAARLRLPTASDHVREGADGLVELRAGRAWVDLRIHADRVETPKDADEVLIFGVGEGELLPHALARAERVVAWDRDPWLLRRALDRHDLREALRAGRLRLALGVDLLRWLPAAIPLVRHPLLIRVYREEALLLDHGAPQPRALLVTGELFVDDLAESLRERGYSVWPWEITRQSIEELVHTARQIAPELVMAVNYRPGLAETCQELGLPLACWEIDPSPEGPGPVSGDTDTTWIFSYRQRTLPDFRGAGFQHVRYLPLAANPRRRHPVPPDPELAAPVVYVGNSMVGRVPEMQRRFMEGCAAAGIEAAHAKAALIAILEEQRRHPCDYRVPAMLTATLPQVPAPLTRTLTALVGEIAAAEHRLSLVATLAPLGVQVWGDPGWKAASPHGVRWRGYAGHARQLTQVYASASVNVDIGRLYQLDIVPMRVFDVLACGGFLLAQHSEALLELFQPGTHLDTWSTPEELLDKARWYLSHPDRAAAIATQGRAEVLRRHTFDLRLAEIQAAMAQPPRS